MAPRHPSDGPDHGKVRMNLGDEARSQLSLAKKTNIIAVSYANYPHGQAALNALENTYQLSTMMDRDHNDITATISPTSL